jgi:hypothetical protein
MISASVVSTITLTYSGSNPWTVFDSSNLATGGALQANWNDVVSQIDGLYKPLLNSSVNEMNFIEGASGARYVGMSGIDGIGTGSTVFSALYAISTAVSAINISAAYAGSAGTLSGYGNIMTTTGSQVMTNKLAAQNHSSYTSPYLRNAIYSTTAATGGACNSGDTWLMYTP